LAVILNGNNSIKYKSLTNFVSGKALFMTTIQLASTPSFLFSSSRKQIVVAFFPHNKAFIN